MTTAMTIEEAAQRYPTLVAAVEEFGDRSGQLLAGMQEATDHYQVNLCRNALAKLLDPYTGDPGCYEARPREIQGEHFVWRRIATEGTGNGGYFVPTSPLTRLGRELNALSRTLIDRLLPEFDAYTLLQAGGLFFEDAPAVWIESEYTTPEKVLQMAGYIAVSCQQGFGWRDIEALQAMGLVTPSLEHSSCPRIETAIMTAAKAVIVRRTKNARKEANNG